MSFPKAKITRFNEPRRRQQMAAAAATGSRIPMRVQTKSSTTTASTTTTIKSPSRQSMEAPRLAAPHPPPKPLMLRARCPTTLSSGRRETARRGQEKIERTPSVVGRKQVEHRPSEVSQRTIWSCLRPQDNPALTFEVRKRRFVTARRDLEMRWRQVLMLWTSVEDAREHLEAATGHKPEMPTSGGGDLQAFANLEAKVRSLPSWYAEVCERVLDLLEPSAEADATREQFRQARNATSNASETMVSELYALDLRTSLLETQNNELSSKLKLAVSTLESERASVTEELEMARRSVEQMEKRSSDMTARVELLEQKAAALDGANELKEEAEKRRDELEARLTELTRTHEQREAELSARCSRLQQQISISDPERAEVLWTELQSTAVLMQAAEARVKDVEEKLLAMRPAEELQRELDDLKAQMATGKHASADKRRVQELESKLGAKQVEVEQLDRRLREQAKLLKVRDELIGLSREKEKQQLETIENLQDELVKKDKHGKHLQRSEDYCRQVTREVGAKSQELRRLHAKLKDRQLQVLQLQKLVQQLEEQHEMAQMQRSELEARVAELETVAAAAVVSTTAVESRSRFSFL